MNARVPMSVTFTGPSLPRSGPLICSVQAGAESIMTFHESSSG